VFGPITGFMLPNGARAFHSFQFLQDKMEEYIRNGARLGWLIDPDRRHVHVYRPDREVEAVSGDPELPGFTLELAEVWDPDAE